jgi:hypothetical protein
MYKQFGKDSGKAILEVRAYNHSIPIAEKEGYHDIAEQHKGFRFQYYTYLPGTH